MDADTAGTSAKEDFNALKSFLNKKKRHIGKLVQLKLTHQVGSLVGKGYLVKAGLESFYSDEIWGHAGLQGWLEDGLRPSAQYSGDLLDKIISNKLDPLENLSPVEKLRVTKNWTDKGKKEVANYICRLNDEHAKAALIDLSRAMEPALKHLFPDN